MKVLLFLNGPEGWQTGIEDGFSHLLSTKVITDLRWFYLMDYATPLGTEAALAKAMEIAGQFQPELIVFFHIASFPISEGHLRSLRNLESKPKIVYDEGDMYGTWAKTMTKSMRLLMREADVVSLRGLGAFSKRVAQINPSIIYTPHHADIARFDREPFILETRENDIVLIGNRIKPRILGWIRRLPGARQREAFVKKMDCAFPAQFVLHGNGWDAFQSNRGPVGFQDQLDVYRNSWITVAYEHYPKIPYYFSNRLPLALLAGSLYVCHYHKGYEHIFQGCNFIFFFKSNDEAVDIINYILSLDRDELLKRSSDARQFAIRHFHPEATWSNFLNQVNERVKP